jgi:hypothetical protein
MANEPRPPAPDELEAAIEKIAQRDRRWICPKRRETLKVSRLAHASKEVLFAYAGDPGTTTNLKYGHGKFLARVLIRCIGKLSERELGAFLELTEIFQVEKMMRFLDRADLLEGLGWRDKRHLRELRFPQPSFDMCMRVAKSIKGRLRRDAVLGSVTLVGYSSMSHVKTSLGETPSRSSNLNVTFMEAMKATVWMSESDEKVLDFARVYNMYAHYIKTYSDKAERARNHRVDDSKLRAAREPRRMIKGGARRRATGAGREGEERHNHRPSPSIPGPSARRRCSDRRLDAGSRRLGGFAGRSAARLICRHRSPQPATSLLPYKVSRSDALRSALLSASGPMAALDLAIAANAAETTALRDALYKGAKEPRAAQLRELLDSHRKSLQEARERSCAASAFMKTIEKRLDVELQRDLAEQLAELSTRGEDRLPPSPAPAPKSRIHASLVNALAHKATLACEEGSDPSYRSFIERHIAPALEGVLCLGDGLSLSRADIERKWQGGDCVGGELACRVVVAAWRDMFGGFSYSWVRKAKLWMSLAYLLSSLIRRKQWAAEEATPDVVRAKERERVPAIEAPALSDEMRVLGDRQSETGLKRKLPPHEDRVPKEPQLPVQGRRADYARPQAAAAPALAYVSAVAHAAPLSYAAAIASAYNGYQCSAYNSAYAQRYPGAAYPYVASAQQAHQAQWISACQAAYAGLQPPPPPSGSSALAAARSGPPERTARKRRSPVSSSSSSTSSSSSSASPSKATSRERPAAQGGSSDGRQQHGAVG